MTIQEMREKSGMGRPEFAEYLTKARSQVSGSASSILIIIKNTRKTRGGESL